MPFQDIRRAAMIDAVRGDESRAAIAGRVEADLSLAFPDVVVMFNDNGQAEVRTAEWSGVAGLIIDGDDQLSDYDVEQATASMTEDIADNLWPESEVPWPRCPAHGDHALQPRLVRGRACWTCLQGDDVEIPIGQLTVP